MSPLCGREPTDFGLLRVYNLDSWLHVGIPMMLEIPIASILMLGSFIS